MNTLRSKLATLNPRIYSAVVGVAFGAVAMYLGLQSTTNSGTLEHVLFNIFVGFPLLPAALTAGGVQYSLENYSDCQYSPGSESWTNCSGAWGALEPIQWIVIIGSIIIWVPLYYGMIAYGIHSLVLRFKSK